DFRRREYALYLFYNAWLLLFDVQNQDVGLAKLRIRSVVYRAPIKYNVYHLFCVGTVFGQVLFGRRPSPLIPIDYSYSNHGSLIIFIKQCSVCARARPEEYPLLMTALLLQQVARNYVLFYF